MATRFDKHGEAYFRFVTDPGIEPTNPRLLLREGPVLALSQSSAAHRRGPPLRTPPLALPLGIL
ncbi:MAG: hypothetical protein KF833_17715 [Verrucomicrobiae bacterium]|nr:hypothetical protein [Verrucomicrobiae bacterium]